ncbi:MAG: hypothetical protein LBE13_04765 [Bacteroidales bacterium]|jgi:hypothetical protein|nr:hypothetical protein [Bacteroidales bacterium]
MVDEIKKLNEFEKQKLKHDFGQHWLFLYEVLSENDLKDEWKSLKKNHVSFILDEYNKLSY